MNLDLHDWKEFRTGDLFPVMERGKASQQKLEEGIDCFYVGAKREDNGVMLHCRKDLSLLTRGNCIVFICNGEGSVGFANYIDVDFIGTTDIMVGYNEYLNERTGAFLATIYSLERPKYSFGRKWGAYLKDTIVRLPAKKESSDSFYIDPTHKFSEMGYVPDWQFMEDYINSLHCKHLTTSNRPNQVPLLNIQQWKEFRVGDYFNIHPTKALDNLTSDDFDDYIGTPVVVNSAENNGIGGYVPFPPTEEGNIITFSDTTDGNTFFYQPEPFIGFAHVQGMYPKKRKRTPKQLLFIATMLMFDSKGKYNYGRKMRRDTIREIRLKLPATALGEPDWEFMENYIKSLPYGDRLE